MLKRLLSVAGLFLLSACGGDGGGGGGNQIPAPGSLSYPPTQALVVGQQMSALTPSVTGTVASYSVAPTLPAGLSLNSSTGMITGTPTAVAAAASYTVTASNSGGSTNAAISITVNDAPPVTLYPKASFKFLKDVMESVTPTSSGGANITWSIHPALPPGLALDPSTGSISGTPSEVSGPAPYVVTARNSGGEVTMDLTVSVESGVLFNLGHTANIDIVRMSSTRVLSFDDTDDHWVLWNAGTRAAVASGYADCVPRWVELIGSTVVIGKKSGFEIREASDGALRSAVTASPSWWSMPGDGSYIVAGNATALIAWSTSNGQQLWSRAGNYANAVAFADLSEIRVARGPAGAQVIETIAAANGGSSVSAAFSGTFLSWFADGARFLTTVSTTVRVYSAAAALEDLKALPSVANLAGQGNYFYFRNGSMLDIFEVANSATAVASYPAPAGIVPQGLRAMLIYTNASPQISVVDWSGPAPVKTDHALSLTPSTTPGAAALVDASHWVFAAGGGVVVDQITSPGTPALFGYGVVVAVAGSETRVAAATQLGKILYFDARTRQLEGEIDFPAAQIELANNGTLLVAASTSSVIKVFSLPGATELSSETTVPPNLQAIELSGDGRLLGRVLVQSTSPRSFGVSVAPTTGGADVLNLSGRYPDGVHLSPDGTLIAVPTAEPADSAANIYRDGTLVGAAAGWPVGWVDNARLLVNTYGRTHTTLPFYSSAFLADAQGNVLQTLPTLPELSHVQPMAGDRIYSSERYRIYSLTTGQVMWSPNAPVSDRNGPRTSAVAADHVIFVSRGDLRAEPY